MGEQVIAIIGARGGSKSIPRKNIKPLAGKPLIAWIIEAALQSHALQRVIVSTDDEEIADCARAFGAEVPFIRPAELARDDTPGIVPVLHALEWLEMHSAASWDAVMALQPTAPLCTARDIALAIQVFHDKNAESVISVCPVHHHPYWMKQLDSQGRLSDFIAQDRLVTRRQDLAPVYALNGAIYLARASLLRERKTWYMENTYPYVMPPERSLDLDTLWDWHIAELVMRERNEQRAV